MVSDTVFRIRYVRKTGPRPIVVPCIVIRHMSLHRDPARKTLFATIGGFVKEGASVVILVRQSHDRDAGCNLFSALTAKKGTAHVISKSPDRKSPDSKQEIAGGEPRQDISGGEPRQDIYWFMDLGCCQHFCYSSVLLYLPFY